MLKNYMKLAWKILLRRKFFTFISLFGISFTIMILVIVTAEADSIIAPISPEVNLNRCLYIQRITFDSNDGLSSSGPVSYYFLNKYARTLKLAENVSIYSAGNWKFTNSAGGRKIEFFVKETDGQFWDIMRFDFTEGKAFTPSEVNKASYVAVISEKIKREFFGSASALGKQFSIGDKQYRVTGVVKDVLKNRIPYADVWVPVTTGRTNLTSQNAYSCNAVILAGSAKDFQGIKSEFYYRLKSADVPRKGYKKILCPVKSYSETLEGGKVLGVSIYDTDIKTDKEQWFDFENTIVIFMSFFLLLPVLNLININTTRIIERSGEIGIRKAFGAPSISLVGQFVFENIILTILGGLIGFILAGVSIYLLNRSPFFEFNLSINYRVMLSGMAMCIILGILSGILPAYKMSRLHPVEALRGGVND